jgi:hypothetical protein
LIRVRVDDFPHTKDGERHRHSLAAFKEFHKRLNECIGGRRYLLGVIPGRCSVDDVLFLRNETDCIIGMHGTDHDEARLDRNGGNQFEPYALVHQVREELLENHTSLQTGVGRPVWIYMPPRNVIDGRTHEILKNDLGVTWVTAGPETDTWVLEKYRSRSILSMPPWEYGRTDELLQRNAQVHLMEESDDDRDVVLTLHWTWETNIGLEHMRRFFDEIPTRYFKDFDE